MGSVGFRCQSALDEGLEPSTTGLKVTRSAD